MSRLRVLHEHTIAVLNSFPSKLLCLFCPVVMKEHKCKQQNVSVPTYILSAFHLKLIEN